MITRALMSAVHSACQWRPAVACTSTGGQVAQRYCSGGANNSSDHAGSAAVTAAVDVRPCGYDFGSPPSRGQVQLLIGPMFSGKSTELLRRVRRYQHARHNCLLIKSAKDGRYSQTQVVTHDDHKNTGIPCISAGDALHDSAEVAERVAAADVVGIDEGHFFGDLAEFCEETANDGKVVVVAALSGTFQRQGFSNVMSLIPMAEDIVKLHAVCAYCADDAAFSLRTSTEDEVEVVGGKDKYAPVCRACFHQFNKHAPQ